MGMSICVKCSDAIQLVRVAGKDLSHKHVIQQTGIAATMKSGWIANSGGVMFCTPSWKQKSAQISPKGAFGVTLRVRGLGFRGIKQVGGMRSWKCKLEAKSGYASQTNTEPKLYRNQCLHLRQGLAATKRFKNTVAWIFGNRIPLQSPI